MKKLAVRLVIAVVVLAAGYWAWTTLFPNPRKLIRQRLNKLAQTASFSSGEGQLAKLARAQKVANFFSDQVVVNVHVPGGEGGEINSRADLLQHAQAAYMMLNGVKAKFADPNIELPPGKEDAIVDVVLTADIGTEKNAVVEELKFDFKKIDGDWLITRVESVNTLNQ